MDRMDRSQNRHRMNQKSYLVREATKKMTKKLHTFKIVFTDYLALSSLGILNMQNLQDAGIPYPASRFIERFLKKI